MKQSQTTRVCRRLLLGLLLGALLCAPTLAEGSAFYVRAILPDNQVDTSLTYFDLRMEPGQKQTIQVEVFNTSSQPITAHTSLHTAATGRDGVIAYASADEEHKRPPLFLADFAQVAQPELIIPADSSRMVDITINMPDDTFDGVLLGGVSVTATGPEDEEDANAADENEAGVFINNRFQYVLGVRVTQNDAAVKPDFDLLGIEPTIINYRTSIAVTLENLVPHIVKGMEVDAKVYDRDKEDTVLYELLLPSADMAPQTSGDFILDGGAAALRAGDYRLHMLVKYEGETWEWVKDFSIADTDADRVNEGSFIDKQSSLWWVLGGIGLLLLIWIIVWLLRRRKDEEEQ